MDQRYKILKEKVALVYSFVIIEQRFVTVSLICQLNSGFLWK